jgi:hypothetical protein
MNRYQAMCVVVCLSVLSACRHPLAIDGEGDIVETRFGVRGCSLEEFRAGWSRCTDNNVTDTESVVYRGLPRPGWKFSHWTGRCANNPPGEDCPVNYDRKWIDWWEDNYPDVEPKPLTAHFVRDDQAPAAAPYIGSRFGARGSSGYAGLLDALFVEDGSYRFTTVQAATSSALERTPASFRREQDSLLLAGPDPDSLVPSGGATSDGEFLTLVDTDPADGEITVTYLMPEQTEAGNGSFSGQYFCGHILTNGQALFSRATLNGKGKGSLVILADRQGREGLQASIDYSVSEDGTTTLDYGGARLAGSLSPGGDVFSATQISSSVQGAAICVRASGNKMIGNVAGGYYGAWMSTQPVTGVTELVLDSRGQTAETVLRDSAGGRNYSLGDNFMLVLASGEIETRDANGAVSPDGNVLFLLQTDPNKFPTLVVYVRQA